MRFGVLGPLRVSVGSAEVGLARRERVLLAVLLLHANRTVSATLITDAVWGDRPPADASGQVHSTVYRLRKQLATAGQPDGLVVTDPAGYRVRVEPRSVDLVEFRELRDQAREAATGGDLDAATAGYRAALALWRGPALDGLASDLVRQAAAGLDEEHLQVVEECVEAELSLGRGRELVAELTELVERHPHREGLHRALMLALYRAGRQADALAAFRRARLLLHDELGIEPGAELQQMQHAILNRDPELLSPPRPVAAGPPQTVPRELPADVSGFTGRAAELKALDELLAGAQASAPAPVVISAIAGTAGVGKTALAVHWGHRVADQFPDGQLYLNLRGYAVGSPVAPAEALAALLRSLGVPPEQIPTDEAQAAALYRTRLADRRMLVVLDNARSVDQVRPLLPGSPGCLALVTSRDRLRGLVARDGAQRITLDVLTAEEARALMTRLLTVERIGIESTAADRLAQLCAYLPLALRIAAANLGDHPDRSIASYLAELTKGDRLTVLRVDEDEATAVEAAIEMSYRRVPDQAQAQFRLLGLVPVEDFTAATSAALSGTSPEEATRALGQLAAAHLIEEPATGRYTFHDLLRSYARQLAESELSASHRAAAVERLMSFYLHSVDKTTDVLYPQMMRLPIPPVEPEIGSLLPHFEQPSDALTWLELERRNLVSTVVHTESLSAPSLAVLLADSLRGYLWHSSYTVDWLSVATAALAAAQREGDLKGQASTHRSLANVHQITGQYAEALEHSRAALELARQANWTAGQAGALYLLGGMEWYLGDLPQAAVHLAEGLPLLRQDHQLGAQAVTHDTLGIVVAELGRLREAAEHHRTAISLARQVGSVVSEANALNNLGTVEHLLGRLDAARATLTDALTLRRELGNRPGAAVTLDGLAGVNRDAGRLAEALLQAEESATLSAMSGNRRDQATSLATLGDIHLLAGRPQQALSYQQRSLDLAGEIGLRPLEAKALLGLAATLHRMGDIAAAVESAQRALKVAQETGYRLIEGNALAVMANSSLSLSDLTTAFEYAQQALENFRTTGHRLGEARTLALLGHVESAKGELPLARTHWRTARVLFTEVGAPLPDDLMELTGG